ncbi:MAG: DNA gyrase inhibitor YacG [Pseudomonadota bacterium]|jgi:endogenous inhibitor of DNA gyrase (YacG/DUF329 family)
MAGAKDKPNSVCRVCGKEIAALSSSHGPFCSERCRLNDLSKWFGENYRIASGQAHVDDDSAGLNETSDGDD